MQFLLLLVLQSRIKKLKMLKVAILDDYQNVSQQFVDLEKLAGKYEIKIFSEPFEDEADALDRLSAVSYTHLTLPTNLSV